MRSLGYHVTLMLMYSLG